MNLYEKYGVTADISNSDFLKKLDFKKHNILRKLNNIFDSPEKEKELRQQLDEIEAAELLIRGNLFNDSNTSLLIDKTEENNFHSNNNNKSNIEKYENTDEGTKLLNLGLEYESKQDYKTALTYFEKSAKLGNTRAQYFVGYYYDVGNGCKLNISKAIFWYSKAAESGDLQALNNLGTVYIDLDNREKAYEYYIKAAEGGNPLSMKSLVYLYKSDNNLQLWYKWTSKYKELCEDEYEKSEISKEINSIIDINFFDYDKNLKKIKNSNYLLKKNTEYKNYLEVLNQIEEIAINEDKLKIEKSIKKVNEIIVKIDNQIKRIEKSKNTNKIVKGTVIFILLLIVGAICFFLVSAGVPDYALVFGLISIGVIAKIFFNLPFWATVVIIFILLYVLFEIIK